MLDTTVLSFLFAFAAIFWIGLFVLTSNPLTLLSRAGAALLFVLSLFILSGSFIFSSHTIEEFRTVLRINAFTIYLSAAIWLHISVLMLNKSDQTKWKNIVLVGYFLAILFSLLELTTNLVINYDVLVHPLSRFKYIYEKGPLFVPAVGFVGLYFLMTGKNLWDLYKDSSEKANEWLKYFLPFLISIVFAGGVALVVSTFFFTPEPIVKEIGEFVLLASVFLLAANVLINRLFLDGAKANLGKEFFYSTITVTTILVLYFALLPALNVSINPRSLVFLSIFIALILLTHTSYDWIMSFVRNVFYQGKVALLRVTDEEVGLALRNLQRPERLEESSLLRLKILERFEKDGQDKISALKKLITEAI